jgi:hypothetical protein
MQSDAGKEQQVFAPNCLRIKMDYALFLRKNNQVAINPSIQTEVNLSLI